MLTGHSIFCTRVLLAPFTLALKPVSNRFKFKPVWPNHYVVYIKWFPKRIRGVHTAALNRFETAVQSAGVNGAIEGWLVPFPTQLFSKVAGTAIWEDGFTKLFWHQGRVHLLRCVPNVIQYLSKVTFNKVECSCLAKHVLMICHCPHPFTLQSTSFETSKAFFCGKQLSLFKDLLPRCHSCFLMNSMWVF